MDMSYLTTGRRISKNPDAHINTTKIHIQSDCWFFKLVNKTETQGAHTTLLKIKKNLS